MKITIRNTGTIELVAEAAAITQSIAIKKPSTETWLRWLHSEHSMIRAFGLRITLIDVPYFVHVHLVRHKKGCKWYVRSQRPTAINAVDYDREKAPQDALVSLILDTNPQALINISQRRLCYKADKKTRRVWNSVTQAIRLHSDPYVAAIADVMMPTCEYRGGICHELTPCELMSYPHYANQ